MSKDKHANKAQADVNQMGMNEGDERAAQKKQAETGQPVRDALGNEHGAS